MQSSPSALPSTFQISNGCPGKVRRAIAFLLTHLDRPLSLGRIAQKVGYSKFHLCRMLRRHLGCSAGKLHAALRLARAEAMLLSGVAPGHVAAELGYTDQAYFTRVFRAKHGVPPGKFARQAAGGPDGRASGDCVTGEGSNAVQDAMSSCIILDTVTSLPRRSGLTAIVAQPTLAGALALVP